MIDETDLPDGAKPSLAGVIDRVIALADTPKVSVRQIVEGFGTASFLPFLMIAALVVVSPLSGVPFLSTVFGITIATISLQMLIPGRDHLWLPDAIMRREISADRLIAALRRIEGPARWVDSWAAKRLQFLVQPPLSVLPKLVCVLCGAAMPFLELVPFSSSILASAVVLICLSILARDGLFALLGILVAGIGFAIPVTVVMAATGE
jgi:hypothetical protein